MVVVTGASGHIGANLVRALQTDGRRVRVLVYEDDVGLSGLDVERVRGDVRDRASLERAFEGAEVVYHLAAVISTLGSLGGLVEAVNIGGVRNVVAACRSAGVRRLVHCASIHAFQAAPLDEPLDETRPLVTERASAYDRSKAAGIRVVQQAAADGLDAVIVCPTAVLGPHDHRESRMGLVIEKIATGRLIATVDGGFDWVDVRDVVAGAIAAEARGRAGELYILGGGWQPVTALAKLVEQATGRPAPRLCAPVWLAQIGAPFAVAFANITGGQPLFTREGLHTIKNNNPLISTVKAEEELGYQSRPLTETVHATVAWQRSAGRLR